MKFVSNAHALVLSAAFSLLVPVVVQAHGSMKPTHGGIVQMSGEILVELVAAPKGLEIYVSEEDEPVPATDFNARLIITAANGTKTGGALSVAGGNKFVAPGVKVPAGGKVVVALVAKADDAKTFATFRMK